MLFSYIATKEAFMSFAQWSLARRLLLAVAGSAVIWLILWSVL